MPLKLRKCDVKIFLLREATVGFALKGMIYSETVSDAGPHRNQANHIAMKLCLVYFGSG